MIQSDHFAASFDVRTGTISVRHSDGTPFLTGGVACANTDLGKQSTASSGREHSVEISPFSDRLGSGRRMVIVSRDPQKLLDLRVEAAVYDRRRMVTIEAHCSNVSSRDVVVTSLEPIRAVATEGGALRVPGVAACITTGRCTTTRARSTSSQPIRRPVPGRPSRRAAGKRIVATECPTVASWWNIGLFNGYEREGVVLGYLENTQALGLVLAAKTAENEVAFLSESVYAPRSCCARGDRSAPTVSC